MATFTITNNRSATEEIEKVICSDGREAYNPGSQTGPKKSNYKFNTIEVPMPKTNVQIKLAPTASVALTTTDTVEVAFFKNLVGAIDGLGVVES